MGSAPLKGKPSPDSSLTEDESSSGSRSPDDGDSNGVFQAGTHLDLICAAVPLLFLSLFCHHVPIRTLHRDHTPSLGRLLLLEALKLSLFAHFVIFPSFAALFHSLSLIANEKMFARVFTMSIGGHGKLSKDPGQEGAIRKVANEAEILFYQTLNGDDPQLVAIPEHIRSFFPKFYGVSDKSAFMVCKTGSGPCFNLTTV